MHIRTFIPHPSSLILLLVLAVPAARGETEAERVAALREKLFTPRLGDQVPLDLTFRDERGQTVTLGDYCGDVPVILVLAYYRCPSLCTLVLTDLVDGLRAPEMSFRAGSEFHVVVVSFDPSEKPDLAAAKKAAYVAEYGRPGAEAGFHFLTGDRRNIDRLTEAVGFKAIWDARQQQYAHARGILVLTPGGKVARYFLGSFPPRDLRFAVVEASEGKVGSAMDWVRIMCFQYNPDTGKYSAAILRLVRVAGVVTVLGLAGFLYAAWRRSRRAGKGVSGAAAAAG
jgi:protein SCO1/2